MEHDAAPAIFRRELDADLADAEAIDDALRPGDVHGAGDVSMIGRDRAIRAVPQADRPVGFDERLVAGAIEDVDEARRGSRARRVLRVAASALARAVPALRAVRARASMPAPSATRRRAVAMRPAARS